MIAAAGAKVEIMTPDRTFAPEVMGMNLAPYMRALQKLDVDLHCDLPARLRFSRDGNGCSPISAATMAA